MTFGRTGAGGNFESELPWQTTRDEDNLDYGDVTV